MKTIHRFELGIVTRLSLPEGADILSIQPRNGQINLWALVDLDKPLVERTFMIIGTGHPLPEDCVPGVDFLYLETVLVEYGALVWHIFEDKR